MRAARLTGWRRPLDIGRVADPEPPAGGVVLRLLASGVCRSDWHAWTGADPVDLPIVPGHEYCGEVVAVGAGVRAWSPGDRAIAPFLLACGRCPSCSMGRQTICSDQVLPGFTCDGAFAELIAVPFADTNLTALPSGMDPAVAAAMGCRITTAWHALTGRAALAPGEWLAVFGGGGIGTSALLLGKALGARVVVVDVVAAKLDFALTLGAEAVINASEIDDPGAAVRDLTGGGADVVIEALGIGETTVAGLRALAKMGRMVQVGMPTGAHATMPIPMDLVYSRQLAVFGTRGMPSWRYPSLLNLIRATGLDLSPLVARRIRLSDASDELAAFDGPAPPGVAVITDYLN